MANGNGGGDWRKESEERLAALERARRELEDSLTVMAQLEARLSRVVRQQAEWLEQHDAEIVESKARLKHIEIGLAEASDKLNALIDREMRREGGPESRL
jgi:septal ring factor EnvC (AmiA/AmiB activator)